MASWLPPYYDPGADLPAGLSSDEFIRQFRERADAYRQEHPDAKIVFCPNGQAQVNITEYYPGGEDVDYIAIDRFYWEPNPY